MSIRRTLLFSLLMGLMISVAAITCVAYFNTAHEMHELFSDNMERMAIVIKDEAFAKTLQSPDAKEANFDEPEESSVIQTWDARGLLLHSSPQIDLPLQTQEGFSTLTIHGQKWDIYTLKADNAGFVQIAQPRRIVSTMVGESAMRTLIPFMVLLIVLGIGVWFIVGKSLSPLSGLSSNIARQDIDQLRPLSISRVPNEVQPIVKALNELLKKLEKAMALQRQFTADAAHELRTPLAAVKLQAGLLRRAQSPEDRDSAIKRLSEGIDRSINMASQLLSASRSAAVKMAPDFQMIRLHEVIRDCLATFMPIASAKNIEIIFEPCDAYTIKGDEEGIRALINNLIDNAIRYTPAGGHVNVGLANQDGKAILKVTDTGPGIPANQRDRIFQRFYRMPGVSSSGAGLGLSIVKDVADNHGAVITITDGPHNVGSMFRIVFFSQSADIAA